MFGGDDEDGDFLFPSGGAKLASLFGLDQEASQGNDSFQYTAPKQPRKSSNAAPPAQKPAPPPGAPAVLFATAVQAFRYINGQYVKQGKLGAAVLGSHTTKEYKLLLYLSQQKQVTAAKIHVGFVFTVQPNNYCTFYDDQRQNWSLMFESDKAASDFCKEVCLAKANSVASLDIVVVQDLSLGEGQAVENGDSLEVVYTGWLLQNHTIGQMFDSNQNKDKLLRLKVGAGKVIKGWEEGMLGMKKAGRRLIIIPPNLAYGSKGVPNRVPPNSTLIFEAEPRRVKFARDSGSDRSSACSRDSAAPSLAPSLAPSPAPSVENLAPEPSAQTPASGPGRPGEQPVRVKSNSLSEQLANPDATKAKLISRMAKMGQPMLPFLTGAAGQPESSDSELEDTSGSRAKDQPAAPSPVPISTAAPTTTTTTSAPANAHPHPLTAQPSALLPVLSTSSPAQPGLQGSTHAFQPYLYTQSSVAPSQLQPVSQVYPAPAVSYMGPSDVTSFLMTEARQHNTEIRLSVGKVADKVDQLASKIDELQKQGSLSMAVPSMSMETSMIMHNIQRIVQENECLKKEVFEKSSRVEEQNRKIGELINENQRCMEQSNLLLEQRNDTLKSSSEQSHARLLQAEQDKVRLTEDLASSTARLSQLQLEASAHQQKVLELQGKLSMALQDSESQNQRSAALEAQLEELKEAVERAQTQYRSEKQRRKEMELRLSNMEEEIQDLKSDKESLERNLLERKKKWQDERQRRDEEVEELRRSSQQEVDNLRAQLRKARTNTDSAASEQLSQLQAELDDEWKKKCEQMLASAKEQHSRESADLTEQRDALQDKLTQLQEKFTVLKQTRESEEQNPPPQSEQSAELLALQGKYSALEQQGVAVREELEKRVAELEKKLEEQEGSGDTAAEVKRVMNGVFHSLRGEFDVSESYSGQAVLGVIVTTIKNVTLQLLSGSERVSQKPKKNEEDAKKERESEEVRPREETSQQKVHVNGERQEKKEEDEHESKPIKVNESVKDQEVSKEKQEETDKETQAEILEKTDPKGSPTSEPKRTETPAVAESEVQEKQKELCVPENSTEEKDKNTSAHLDDEPDERSPPADREESVSEVEAEVSSDMKESLEEGEREEEIKAASQNALSPPVNPPPPPNAPQKSSGEDTSLTGGMGVENGEEPFFQITTPAKPPAAPSEEEEEDEMSLKGRPPPTPLFGDDEDDDDDLDWLN
ncbi:FK506-binding protein 15 isoform X2 [Cheilinus undulatus]|uniref:FK506-binding protein 15 isoform X2 n=1 Tax=Cheilinus undulatus TaxID=241271 RepID=UPI001BD258C6|nr:FK506-binding protein 15 isoform X2 [Cheilinus undulatus]